MPIAVARGQPGRSKSGRSTPVRVEVVAMACAESVSPKPVVNVRLSAAGWKWRSRKALGTPWSMNACFDPTGLPAPESFMTSTVKVLGWFPAGIGVCTREAGMAGIAELTTFGMAVRGD